MSWKGQYGGFLYFYLRFVTESENRIDYNSLSSKTQSNWNLLSQLTIFRSGTVKYTTRFFYSVSDRLNNNFHTFSYYYESARATEWSVMRRGGLGCQGSEFLAMVLYIIIFRLLRLILGGLTCKFLSNTDKCMPLEEVSSFKYYLCTDIGYPIKNLIPKTTWNWI